MDIRVVSSSVGGSSGQFAASCVINDVLTVDAGSIGFSEIARQKQVRSLLISHSHLDHIASLPIFIDNVYASGTTCPTVYASEHCINALKTHFFNDVVWPDVIRLSKEESPFIRFVTLEEDHPISIENVIVTPVALNHIIPTFGFIIDDGNSAVAFVSDTAPTVAIWEQVRQNPRITAVFLEATFPNSMAWLAHEAKHLTPSLFGEQCALAGRDVQFVAVHIKPAYYDTVVRELRELNLENLVISQPNQTYRY